MSIPPIPVQSQREMAADPARSPGSLARYFEVSLLCALATAFFTLACTGRLDTPAIVLFSAALLTRLLILARRRNWRLGAKAVTILSVSYLCFYPFDLIYLARGSGLPDRMLVATVHLVLFATAIKVLSASTRRDHTYLAVLSFVMMLAAAVLTVGAVYIAGFCLYMLFTISTLVSYQVLRPQVAAACVTRSPDPETPTQPQTCDSIETALGKTAVALAMAVVPLAALLFFAIPRYRSGYWWRIGLEQQHLSGFAETVDLGAIGRILRSSQVVMRVTPEGDPRRLAGEKLRGIALANFDGHRWWNGDRSERVVTPVSLDRFRPPDFTGLATRPAVSLRYQVLLEPLSSNVLFLAGRATEIGAHLRFMLADRTGSLIDPLHVPGPFTYSVVSESGTPTARELRQTPEPAPSEITDPYLNLPRLDPRVSQLAHQVTANSRTNYDRTVAVRDYLQSHFEYSLDLPSVEPADPVTNFLFETKRGNCEFFAATMAVMLRSIRIPTRMVNGFQINDYNPVGKDFVIRGRDAHSWVEVYFPKQGWVPFDPTPAGSDMESSMGLLRGYLDAAQLFWNEWVVNYDFGRQVELALAVEATSRGLDRRFQALRRRFERLGSGRLALWQDWLSRHGIKALALIIILLAFATLAVRHPAWIKELRAALAWQLASRRGAPPAHAATLAYQRFLGTLTRKGIEKAPADTPREFASKLQDPSLRREATSFTEIYQAARFGHKVVAVAEIESALRSAIKAASTPPVH